MDSETAVINKSTITEQVFKFLRQGILSNKFRSGERLKELAIARELSVSRTPVREAIRMLEAEGLVVRKAYGQSVVAERTLEDMVETFHVRIALESYAVRLVAEIITEEQIKELTKICDEIDSSIKAAENQKLKELGHKFHNMILDIAGNRRIREHIYEINEHIDFYRERLYTSTDMTEANMISHREVLEAIIARDGDLAQELIRGHLAYALDLIKSIWNDG
jgi:DNA-binding GntR family transcriptional regulator